MGGVSSREATTSSTSKQKKKRLPPSKSTSAAESALRHQDDGDPTLPKSQSTKSNPSAGAQKPKFRSSSSSASASASGPAPDCVTQDSHSPSSNPSKGQRPRSFSVGNALARGAKGSSGLLHKTKSTGVPGSKSTGGTKSTGAAGPKSSGGASAPGAALPTVQYSSLKEPVIFSPDELEAATENYKELVGKGGFGAVYKGQVVDGATRETVLVAVKVLLSEDEKAGEEDLMREIVAVAQLQHEFILRLVGYCNQEPVKALVYDFMGGGDVEQLLRKSREGAAEFPWEQRLEVALGCARALAFMHEQHCVHRDFKAPNVLLTEDLLPRVADFGLVKFIQDWHSHCTTRVKGSVGYMDPMYFTIGHVHTKSDVYAFGVFLVELLSGKSVYDATVHEDLIPALNAGGRVTEAAVRGFLDPRIADERMVKQAKAVAELARRSLQDHWEERPNMKDLVMRISRLRPQTQEENTTSTTRALRTGQEENGGKTERTGQEENADGTLVPVREENPSGAVRTAQEEDSSGAQATAQEESTGSTLRPATTQEDGLGVKESAGGQLGHSADSG